MKILCCVKQVPDTNTQIQLSPDRKDIARESVAFVMSPYDEFAVEEALRIKSKVPGSTVTVITLGPARADQVLRTALAMGCDEAIHLVDEKSLVVDPLVVAKCLVVGMKGERYDLIFCGRQAVDDDAFQIGSAMASLLDIGHITIATVVRIDVNSNSASVDRIVEGGIKQTVTGKLPLLITVQKGLNEPRFASLPGIMKAKSKPVTKKKVEELGVTLAPKVEIKSLELPNYKRKVKIFATETPAKEAIKELFTLLRAEAKVLE